MCPLTGRLWLALLTLLGMLPSSALQVQETRVRSSFAEAAGFPRENLRDGRGTGPRRCRWAVSVLCRQQLYVARCNPRSARARMARWRRRRAGRRLILAKQQSGRLAADDGRVPTASRPSRSPCLAWWHAYHLPSLHVKSVSSRARLAFLDEFQIHPSPDGHLGRHERRMTGFELRRADLFGPAAPGLPQLPLPAAGWSQLQRSWAYLRVF